MKILVCGAGRIARQLLKRMGERWEIVLIDKQEERLVELAEQFPVVSRTWAEDASSRVVLDEAGVGEFEYVLALTDRDRINLAVCEYAREQGVNHLLAVVGDPENEPAFHDLGVRTISISTAPARSILHYLEAPRVHVTPLATGQGEVLELDVPKSFYMLDRPVKTFVDPAWRIAALHRDKELVFPGADTVIRQGDRLVILGRPDQFLSICTHLECGRPHFPLSYGKGMVLALGPGKADQAALMEEAVHLAQNTQVKHVTVVCPGDTDAAKAQNAQSAQKVDLQWEDAGGDLQERVVNLCQERDIGVAVIPPLEGSPVFFLVKPRYLLLAQSLPCPLLVARSTQPYRRILVPYNATPMAKLALETALDMGKQMKAEVLVAVVEEPNFLYGNKEFDAESVLKQAREQAREHRVEVEEVVQRGNPVREIAALSSGCGLLVLGGDDAESGLFSPNVADLMIRKAHCSVLVITS